MKYQQAIWARLHGEFDADDVAVFAFPETPRRLRSHKADKTDSWVTLIFGAGVRYEGDLVELLDDQGQVVPFTQANGRWGPGHTRVLRIQPDEDLVPGGWYTARMRSDAELINGGRTTQQTELTFQVACDDPADPLCPELGDIPVASITGIPEVEEPVEASEPETGCGCVTAPGVPLPVVVLMSALGLRRRQ